MACIGGILLWVASNMIKRREIREVVDTGKFEIAMMVYTAVMVPLTDFLTGVLSALIIYFVVQRFFPTQKKKKDQTQQTKVKEYESVEELTV